MPKRRARLTLKRPPKRIVQPEDVSGTQDGPSSDEWASMKQYKAFYLNDSEGNRHQFSIGNHAIILPDGRSPTEKLKTHEYWVGKIKDVRCRENNPLEVWAEVKWFYSGSDIAQECKSFDRVSCAMMERFVSTRRDYVHSACFQEVVKCIAYDESDLEQRYISEDNFFYRHSYATNTKRITPIQEGTCLCGNPYNPDTTSLMVFCPRPGCQKAYDYSCLEKTGNIGSLDAKLDWAPRHIQLERSLPFIPVKETRERILCVEDCADVKGKGSCKNSLEGRYEQISPSLLALARSSMMKGKLLSAGGVVGNIPFVYRARQIVYDVLKCGISPPTDLKTALGLHEAQQIEDLITEDKNLVCPKCGGAI